jgi:hypothetical protein
MSLISLLGLKVNKAIHIVCVPMILMTSFLFVGLSEEYDCEHLLMYGLGYQYATTRAHAQLARHSEPSA